MDGTKNPIGALTMVYKDYQFLARWYDYYGKQLGYENLFVFSHGNDPEHRRIAANANVINVPRNPGMHLFDRRRWRMMSALASGMLEFYNWMIVSDVDEILVVDPDVAPGLVGYVAQTYADKKGPKNLSPLGIELIHLPEEEPLPIADDATVLSRRRIFRPSRNYSKPCLVGAPVVFGPGGHRNNLGRRHMPEGLYLIHLKYFDLPATKARAEAQEKLLAEALDVNAAYEDHPWLKTLKNHLDAIETMELTDDNSKLESFRKGLHRQRERYTNQFVWGAPKNTHLFRLPERFADVF